MKGPRIITSLSFTVALCMLSCSYGMDALEGLITKRASFSIEAEYSGGFVTVTWDESPSTSCFAGNEIYMTTEPDNEYSNYVVIAAPYALDSGIVFPPNVPFIENLALSNLGFHSIAVNVSSVPTGIYYFRVGQVFYEEEKLPDGSKQCYTDGQFNYEDHATLDAVSGYRGVAIP